MYKCVDITATKETKVCYRVFNKSDESGKGKICSKRSMVLYNKGYEWGIHLVPYGAYVFGLRIVYHKK